MKMPRALQQLMHRRIVMVAALVLAVIAVLALGFFPRSVMRYAEGAGQDLKTSFTSQGR